MRHRYLLNLVVLIVPFFVTVRATGQTPPLPPPPEDVPVALFKSRHTDSGVVQVGAVERKGHYKIYALPMGAAAGWDRE